jgi:hypothetical protein
VHGVNDVRQREIHTAEPLVPEPSAFEVQMAIEKLKRLKSPGTDKIRAEMTQAGGRSIRSEIHKLINSICNKDELPQEWKESIILPIYKKGDKTNRSNYIYIYIYIYIYFTFVNYVPNFIQHPAFRVNSICRVNYWGSSVWISPQQVNY